MRKHRRRISKNFKRWLQNHPHKWKMTCHKQMQINTLQKARQRSRNGSFKSKLTKQWLQKIRKRCAIESQHSNQGYVSKRTLFSTNRSLTKSKKESPLSSRSYSKKLIQVIGKRSSTKSRRLLWAQIRKHPSYSWQRKIQEAMKSKNSQTKNSE